MALVASFELDVLVYPELGMDALTVIVGCPAALDLFLF